MGAPQRQSTSVTEYTRAADDSSDFQRIAAVDAVPCESGLLASDEVMLTAVPAPAR